MGRKWNNIKEKKAQKDKNTSRIYAKFGKEPSIRLKAVEMKIMTIYGMKDLVQVVPCLL